MTALSNFKILAMWDNASGVEYHRILKPFQRMHIEDELGANELFLQSAGNITKAGIPDLRKFDLIVFNRYLGKHHDHIIEYLAKNKIPFVVDIDDYWKVPKYHPAAKYYSENNLSTTIKRTMEYADGVTCSTDYLAESILPLNKNVCVIPNALDTTDEQWNQPKSKTERYNIGYLAGVTHTNDAMFIGDVIKQILDTHENVDFVYCGYMPQSFESRSMLKRLQGYEEKSRLKVITAMEPSRYGIMLSHLDLVLAPLEETHYNNCKSDIKVLEAQAYGLPIICSDVPPYQQHIFSPGVTLVANKHDLWIDAIEHTMKMKYKSVYNRDLCDINIKRIKFYRQCTMK